MSYSFKKESWHLKKECNLILFLCTIWHHDCNIFLNTVVYWVICLWTSISSVSNTTSCDCFSNYFNIFSLVNVPFRYNSDVMFIASTLISVEVLTPHLTLVLKVHHVQTDHHIIVPPQKEFIWEISFLHIVSVHRPVFFIFPF